MNVEIKCQRCYLPKINKYMQTYVLSLNCASWVLYFSFSVAIKFRTPTGPLCANNGTPTLMCFGFLFPEEILSSQPFSLFPGWTKNKHCAGCSQITVVQTEVGAFLFRVAAVSADAGSRHPGLSSLKGSNTINHILSLCAIDILPTWFQPLYSGAEPNTFWLIHRILESSSSWFFYVYYTIWWMCTSVYAHAASGISHFSYIVNVFHVFFCVCVTDNFIVLNNGCFLRLEFSIRFWFDLDRFCKQGF